MPERLQPPSDPSMRTEDRTVLDMGLPLHPVPFNHESVEQVSPVVPYETERGAAFRAVNQTTGEAINPPNGVTVEIFDEWAAEEVSEEISSLDIFLRGEQDTDAEKGAEPQTLKERLDSLSHLSWLHLDKAQVDAIESRIESRDDGGWRWPKGEVADKVAEEQVRVLSVMMRDSDTLSHSASVGGPALIKSGALKPKAGHDEYRSFSGDNYKLKTQGASAVKDEVNRMVASRASQRATANDENIPYRGYPDTMGLHSQLVHFSETSPTANTSYQTVIQFPRGAVMGRTPIAMVGQDARGSTGVGGVKNSGDEAHHGSQGIALRDRFARVHVEVSPELQSTLRERGNSSDITFMAATDTAEHAVDFEYPLEESMLFVRPYDARKVIEDVASSDESDTVMPATVREVCAAVINGDGAENKGELSLRRFSHKAVKIKDEIMSGEKHEYKSERSEAFWNEVAQEMDALEQAVTATGRVLYGPGRERIASTVLLRRSLIAMGRSLEWARSNVFVTSETVQPDALDEFASEASAKWMRERGGDFSRIQAKSERLQFDQLDLLTQLPIYKS